MSNSITASPTQEIPYGYCHCGCGNLAPIAPRSNRKRGYSSNPGESHPNSLLNDEKVLQVRDSFRNGIKKEVLASEYGVSVATIKSVVYYRSWKHVP